MKIRKGTVEISINEMDWERYKKAGWSKKREVRPEVTKERWERKKNETK